MKKITKSVFSNEATFVGTSWLTSTKPPLLNITDHPDITRGLPEIAFAGESNAGKSSLINALLYQKDIVRTSRKPGHTRALNFFNIADRLLLVDMPGYGRKSESEWGDMTLKYLESRRYLRRLYLLRDCRKGFSTRDNQLMRILEDFGVSYQIVLTKADLFPPELANFKQKVLDDCLEYTGKRFPNCVPQAMFVSSKTGEAVEEVRQDILKVCKIHK